MDMSKTESKRVLRSLELKAYRNVVDALRAQGSLNKNNQEMLKNLAAALKVGEERCRSEIRRAVNDDLLNSIAQSTNGKNTENGWRTESVKKVPSTPMFAAETVFTALADNISDLVSSENERLLESNKSLREILESHERITQSNSSRYHATKLLGSLLANKTFRYDSIMPELEKIVKYNCSDRSSSVHSKDVKIATTEPKKTVQWHNELSTTMDSAPVSQSIQTRQRNNCSLSKKSVNRTILKPVIKMPRITKPEIDKNESSGSCNKTESKKSEFTDPIRDFVNQLVNKDRMNLEARSIASLKTNVNYDFNSSTRTENINRGNISSKRSKRKKKQWNQRRLSKVARNRQLNSMQRMKTKMGTSSPNKNARRRKGDVTKSMEDDFIDVDSTFNAKKLQLETDKKVDAARKSDEKTESALGNAKIEENASNNIPASDNFRIEIGRTPLEDDMKPHTFNLIPASRRLKLLQKRAQLSNDESVSSAKKPCHNRENSSNTHNCDNDLNVKSSLEENSNSLNRLAENLKEKNSLTESILSRCQISRNLSISPQVDGNKEKLSLLGNIKVRNLNELSKDPPKKAQMQGKCLVSDKSMTFSVEETSSDSISESESLNKGFRGFPSANGFNDYKQNTFDSSSESSESSTESGEGRSDNSETENGQDSENKMIEVPVSQPLQIEEQLIDIESADVIIEDLEEHLSAEEDEAEPVIQKEDSKMSKTKKKVYNKETSRKASCSDLEINYFSESLSENSRNIYNTKNALPVSDFWNSLKTYSSSKTGKEDTSQTITTLPSVIKTAPSVVTKSPRNVQIFGKISSNNASDRTSANIIRKIALDHRDKVSRLLLLTKKDMLSRPQDDLSNDKKIKVTEETLHSSDSSSSASSRNSPTLQLSTQRIINLAPDETTKFKLVSPAYTGVNTSEQLPTSEDKVNVLSRNELKAREHFADLVYKLKFAKKELPAAEQKESAASTSDSGIKITNKPLRLLTSATGRKIILPVKPSVVVLAKSPHQSSSRPHEVSGDEKTKVDSDSVLCNLEKLSIPQDSSSSEKKKISADSNAGKTENVIQVARSVVLSKGHQNLELSNSSNTEKVKVSTDLSNKMHDSVPWTIQKSKLPTGVPTTSIAAKTLKLQLGLPVRRKTIQLYGASVKDERSAEPSSEIENVEKNSTMKKGTLIEISSSASNSDYEIADSMVVSDNESNENGS